MGIWITPTAEQIRFADDIAKEHLDKHIRLGSIDTHTNGQAEDDYETLWRKLRNGYRAEVPVRLWLGPKVRWSIRDTTPGKADFGDIIDVKARQETHHRLTITPQCKSHFAFLLVCGARHPDYHIIGWCWGSEGMREKYWSDPGTGRPAWWIPEQADIMKHPDTLLDVLRSKGFDV